MTLLTRLLGCGMFLLAGGCALPPGPPPVAQLVPNPLTLPADNPDRVFSQVVDVMDDYFTIDREEPVRQFGEVLTEGRIDTFPEVGSTMLEPWRGDAANSYEKLEGTLQTIRRRAVARVIPTAGGLLIDLAVFKELEDLKRPEHATAGAATLRTDGSLTRYTDPVAGASAPAGWIPLGRDTALEQQMLARLQSCLGGPGRLAPF